MTINKNRLIRLTQKLIQINSENPPGDESRIADFVVKYLKDIGLKTHIYEFKKNRSNAVAVLGQKRNRHSLLVTPHLDTVPAGEDWRFGPFSGEISGDKIYGLGATDRKGDLACLMEAINSIVENNVSLGYNLIFAATADEENGSHLGLIPLLKKGILKPDAAVVLDTDDFSIVVAQKGLLHIKVRVQGKRAHGAYPWLGKNAIDISLDILRELKRHKFKYKAVRYLRSPTVNIGTIKGGDKVNVVADWCDFELDFRFLPGMSAKEICTYLKRLCGKYAPRFRIEIEGVQAPYLIEKDHALVSYLRQAMYKAGARPLISGSEGATVITFFQEMGIPAIATGFGSQGCNHITNEYSRISNLYKGAQVLAEFFKIYRAGR
ncbi:MAG: M20 family metallopeptidase [Candidatus Omnitrophota bacterium]